MMLKQGDAVPTRRRGVGSALAPVGVFLGEICFLAEMLFSTSAREGEKTFRNCDDREFT